MPGGVASFALPHYGVRAKTPPYVKTSAAPVSQGPRNQLMHLPAAADTTYRDRCQQKRNDFRNPAQTLLAHPAAEAIGIAERDGYNCQIHHERCQRVKEANAIDQDKQSGEQRRACN